MTLDNNRGRRAGSGALALVTASLAVAAMALPAAAQGIQRPPRTGPAAPVAVSPPAAVVNPPPSPSGPPVSAGNLVSAQSPQRILDIMRNAGYDAKLTVDGVGDPAITGNFGDTPYYIYFYGCTEHVDCKMIQYQAGYDMRNGISLDVVNEWNHDNLWGQAYRDDEDDPWISITVNLFGGVTPENLVDTFEWFEVTTTAFEEHINW